MSRPCDICARGRLRENTSTMTGAGGAQPSSNIPDVTDTLPGRDLWSSPRAIGAESRGSSRLYVSLERHRLTAGGRRLVLDDLDEVVVARGTPGRIERAGRTAVLLVGDFETSRRHLVIRRAGVGWEVQALAARNGTLVNGERVARAELAHGDFVEAGGSVLWFAAGGGPAPAESDRDLEDAPVEPI